MPSRQIKLLIGLAAVVLLWLGGQSVDSWLLAPLRELRANVAAKEESVASKELQVLAIERAKAKMTAWRARSFAPDSGRKAQLTATEALRHYTELATELAHAVALDEVVVAPVGQSPNKGVYVEVVVEINGEGRYSQFLQMLERIYRADVLQRIGSLQVTSTDVVGDPPVRFSMNVAALAMPDAAPQAKSAARPPLFPRTTLKKLVEANATTLFVTSSADFPQKTPFRIRIERELLDVTAATATEWTVTRGVERTDAAEHPERSNVSLVRLDKNQPELSRAEFGMLVRENVFVKPSTQEYDFQFGPFAPPPVVRGKPWEFSVAAQNVDPARGDPSYRFVGDAPPGLALNAGTGQLTWNVESGVATGEYPIEVEVRHPAAENGQESQQITLIVAEPNTPPKFAKLDRQFAYRGQPVEITASATDEDKPAQKLTYKLGPGAPKEAKVDAKTGKVDWTPAENQQLGPAKLAIVVTDSGTPSQSTTLNLSIDVEEDSARTTELTGIVGTGAEREAFFSDKSQDRTTIVRVGDELRAANVAAKIVAIDAETVTVEIDDKERTMKLGDNVRSLAVSELATRRGSVQRLP